MEEIDEFADRGIFTKFKSLFKNCKMPNLRRHTGKADFTQTKLEEKEALPDQLGNKTECSLLQVCLISTIIMLYLL